MKGVDYAFGCLEKHVTANRQLLRTGVQVSHFASNEQYPVFLSALEEFRASPRYQNRRAFKN